MSAGALGSCLTRSLSSPRSRPSNAGPGGGGVTRQQQKALDFIKGYIERERVPPSYGEIAAGVGIKSRSGALRLVCGVVVEI